MTIVQTLAEANEIQNKIRTRKVANGYAVYVRGDVVPELPQQSNKRFYNQRRWIDRATVRVRCTVGRRAINRIRAKCSKISAG